MFNNDVLTEINKQLLDEYGRFETTDKPKFRLVWSHDVFEKRISTHTRDGFWLTHPEIIEVPKYRQWNDDAYILEILVPVPPFAETDLVDKISYEPLWTFRDKDGFPLTPIYRACKFVIDLMYENMRTAGVYTKYKQKNESPEEYKSRIDELERQLYGDRTAVTDALASGSGVSLANTQKEN